MKSDRLFFLLFFISVGLHKSNYLISLITGVNVQSSLGFSLLVFPLIFALGVLYSTKSVNGLAVTFRKDKILLAILTIVHIDLLYGLIMGNSVNVITQEYWTGLIVLFGYRLATDYELLGRFDRGLLPIFVLFGIATFIGTQYLQEHLTQYERVFNRTTATLAYEISPILDFWPFLFLVPYFKGGRNRFLVFLPFIVYFVFQLYFLKRAPSVRALSFLLMAFTLKSWQSKSGVNLVLTTVFGLLLILITAFLFVPDELLARFQTEDNARQREAFIMLSQLNLSEWIFGRGLGGYYYMDSGAGLIEVNSDGELGKHILHIGALYPILKGGLVLAFFIYVHVIGSVRKGFSQIKHLNEYQLSALVFLTVYSLFRIIEGPISPGSIFDGFLFGLSLGLLNQVRR